MTDIAPSIERFDLTVGPLTFQARQAGPSTAARSSSCTARRRPRRAGTTSSRFSAPPATGPSPSRSAATRPAPASTPSRPTRSTSSSATSSTLPTRSVPTASTSSATTSAAASPGPSPAITPTACRPSRSRRRRTRPRSPTPTAARGPDRDDQHERSGYMRMIKQTPRGDLERMFLAGGDQTHAGHVRRSSRRQRRRVPGDRRHVRRHARLDGLVSGRFEQDGGGGPGGLDADAVRLGRRRPCPRPCRGGSDRWSRTGPYRFVVLEGAGHWIPELAADRFNARARRPSRRTSRLIHSTRSIACPMSSSPKTG